MRTTLSFTPSKLNPYNLTIFTPEFNRETREGIYMLDGFETLRDAWAFAIVHGFKDPCLACGTNDKYKKWTKEPEPKRKPRQLKLV